MGMAIVNLHWSPDQFWNSTAAEFYSAVEIFDDQADARNNKD